MICPDVELRYYNNNKLYMVVYLFSTQFNLKKNYLTILTNCISLKIQGQVKNKKV